MTQVVKDQFNKEGEERKLVLSTNANIFEMCTPAWKIDDNDNIILNEPCRSECCEQRDLCTKEGCVAIWHQTDYYVYVLDSYLRYA